MIGVGIDLFRYGGGGGAPFELTNSLIFDSASSQYASQTMSAPTGTKWTFSTWLKIDSTGANKMVFTAGVDSDDYDYVLINSSGSILVYHGVGGGTAGYVYTGNVITVTDQWYHLAVVFDPTLASASRMKIYLDGVEQSITVDTAFSSTYINTAIAHSLGVRYRPPSTRDSYFDGHLAATYFVDGDALDVSSFYAGGTYVNYTGSYGTNGFRLLYDDGASTTTLGYDTSGNDNHWTLSNMTTANQSTDVPA